MSKQRDAATEPMRCTFCGGTDRIEKHHVGGRNHAPWFTLPLCRRHHVEITKALCASEVDMRHTTNRIVRVARAIQGLAMFLWQLAAILLTEASTNEH